MNLSPGLREGGRDIGALCSDVERTSNVLEPGGATRAGFFGVL